MARYNEIRFDVQQSKPSMEGTIRLYRDNMNTALYNAIQEAVLAGTRRMAERISKSATPTGRARRARGGLGPGRRKTDAMYRSIWNATGKGLDRMGDTHRIRERAGLIAIDFGFIDAPYYTKFQEGGTRVGARPTRLVEVGLSGYRNRPIHNRDGSTRQRHPGIKPMFAFQHGWNAARKSLLVSLSKEAMAAQNAALAGKLLRRANTQSPIRTEWG